MAQGLLIDMDGVIYSGDALIPGADKFIARLLEQKIPFMFMTNNSQRTRVDAVRKLEKLGIKVPENFWRVKSREVPPMFWVRVD
jgi:NagD protein